MIYFLGIFESIEMIQLVISIADVVLFFLVQFCGYCAQYKTGELLSLVTGVPVTVT